MGMTLLIEPPFCAVIAASADFENLAVNSQFFNNLPKVTARTLMPDFSARMIPASLRTTGVTSCTIFENAKLAKIYKSVFLLTFKKLMLGIRRNNGVCPPSKTKISLPPHELLTFLTVLQFYRYQMMYYDLHG